MKPTPLWQVTVTISAEAEEAVTEMVGRLTGGPVSAYTDAETGRTVVSAYLIRKPGAGVRADLKAGLERTRGCGLNVAPGKVAITRMRREAWAHSWKRHFHPLEIGSALLITPSWSRRRPRRGQKWVVLDPGLSFGTGQHPTTRYCLREMVRHVGRPPTGGRLGNSQTSRRRARSFLDLGTGSGILAIAAAKLGYAPVHAIDSDSDAVRIARRNAQRNGVGRQIKITRKDLTCLPRESAWKYDFICANLISTLVIAECNRILGRLQKGGVLVLAGILKSEFAEVRRACERRGLRLTGSCAENEWRSGTFRFGA